MNTRPNVPEDMNKYSSWLLFAMVTGAANAFLFHNNLHHGLLAHARDHYQGWPIVLRVIVDFIPAVACFLWARSMVQWTRGLDEMHRRITLEAWIFAAIATLVFISIWPLLEVTGVSTGTGFQYLAKPNLTLTIGMLYVFFGISHSIINRRYQ